MVCCTVVWLCDGGRFCGLFCGGVCNGLAKSESLRTGIVEGQSS